MKKTSIIFVLFFSILFSFAISNWGLTEKSSEARYAQISKEMYVTGDYIYPRLLGIYHFHKPPLTYYITCIGYALFGLNETGARFFLMIALIIQLLLVYKITNAFYKNQDMAMSAMLIYFSYPLVLAATKNLTTDAYLASFIFASVWFFISYQQQKKVASLYLFYLFCGLAFLTKGPVGIMPQALFAAWYQVKYRPKHLAGFHSYTAFLLGLLVCFSWFILVVVKNPALLNYFFKHQLVDRVASNAFSRSQPWWYYFVTMPIFGLPAMIYFADYLRTIPHSGKAGNTRNSILLFSLAISFLVFSLSSSKLVLYVLPLYLFIAMLSGMHLVNMEERKRIITQKISLWYAVVIFSCLLFICFLDVPFFVPLAPTILLATAGIIASFLIYFNTGVLSILKGPLLNAWVMIILMIALPFIMKQNEIKFNSIKPLAVFINGHSSHTVKGTVAVYDYLLPSISFYCGQRIITIDNGNSHAKREIQFENPAEKNVNGYIKINRADDLRLLAMLLKEPGSFLVAKKSNDLPDSLSYLRNPMHHKTTFDKWVIYY